MTILSVAFPFAPVGVDAVGGAEQILALLNRGITEAGHAMRREGIDVVHMHGLDFAEYLPDRDCAVLATLHLPVSFYPREVFALPRPVRG